MAAELLTHILKYFNFHDIFNLFYVVIEKNKSQRRHKNKYRTFRDGPVCV